jgi:uncharacterized membrane protein YphA (DoxX/SURF4 family)
MTAPATSASDARPSKALHIVLWVLQVALGVMFLSAGLMKATTPIADLAAKMVWPGVVPPGLVRFIGASELLGGIGLILPAATRVKPGLTPLAALGLVAVMVCAAIFHISRGEVQMVPINVVLGGLAGFVAWGRFKKATIAPR